MTADSRGQKIGKENDDSDNKEMTITVIIVIIWSVVDANINDDADDVL